MATPPTLGLELELWVVDEDGRLSDAGDVPDAHERVDPEFVPPLLEVRTEPHDCVAALRRDLGRVLAAAIEAAEAADRKLVPLATPLTTARPSATTERGEVFERVYGEGIVGAKNCAGTHVHFEQGDVLAQLQLLTALDPALALVSSSPYYRSERRGSDARARGYRTDCGEQFQPFCDLWGYPESVAAWRERVDEVYEDFCAIAEGRGVSRSTVAEHFSPEDAVLNPVRLREEQPTVEWRAPDAALPSQVLQLATDVRSLVAHVETTPVEIGRRGIDAEVVGLPAERRLRDLSDGAIRTGLDSAPVRAYLRSMGIDPGAYEPLSPTIEGPARLTEAQASEIRLHHAELLRADVDRVLRPRAAESTWDEQLA